MVVLQYTICNNIFVSRLIFIDIILDIQVPLQSPVNKLREQNLSTSILVNLLKLCFHVLYWSNPLLNCGFQSLRSEFFFGNTVIIPGVDPIKSLVIFKELPD